LPGGVSAEILAITSFRGNRSDMECSSCGHRNEGGASFCVNCGSFLTHASLCESCGALTRPGQKFCGLCGEPLGEPTASRGVAAAAGPADAPPRFAPEMRPPVPVEAERKLVTVLFADLKGSTRLSGSLDADLWWSIVRRFSGVLYEGVNRYEGRVEQFTGDGIMAVFGAPLAQEDHARRACHAALWLAERLSQLGSGLRAERGIEFSVRMGLNSGQVVVGAIGDDMGVGYAAIGHAAALAQRMESVAEPGTVYLTSSTARLVEGFFTLEDRGVVDVRGVSDPIQAYRLVDVTQLRTALEVATIRGLSRYVGRDRELGALDEALRLALEASGQVVGVVAEPGIGKSRLCHEFIKACAAQGIAAWSAHALAHTRRVPFVSVLEILRDYFGLSDRVDAGTARAKITARVAELRAEIGEALPLLCEFLGVADPEVPAAQIDPEARQRRLFAALNELVRAQTEQRSMVLLLEDLHWMDPGSEAFLENLVHGLVGTRTLLLVTFRPRYHREWMAQSCYRQLPLGPLSATASKALLHDLLGDDRSLDGLSELVVEHTGGNPFFIEEAIRSLAENGTLVDEKGAYRLARTVAEVEIPATVETVLAARIDQLEERDKQLLQTAAVIGRNFSERLLARVTGRSAEHMRAALRALGRAELIFERATYPEVVYSFKHALTEHVAYRSQIDARRARIHGDVAAAIEELFPDGLDERSALVAHHWENAGELLQAARWNARAARWAGFSDFLEAQRRWRDVLRLTDALPESPERAQLALGSRMMLLNFAWRLGVPEDQALEEFGRDNSRLYEEARAIAVAGDQPGLQATIAVIYGATRGFTGDLEGWLELSTEGLGIAERLGDRESWVGAAPGLIYALWSVGRYPEEAALCERVIHLAAGDPTIGSGASVLCPLAFAYFSLGWARAMTGQLDEVRQHCDTAIGLARGQRDIENQGWPAFPIVVSAELGGFDSGDALRHADRAVELFERAGGAFSRGIARQHLGVALVGCERWTEAIEALQQSLELWRQRRLGGEAEPISWCYMSRAHLGLGDTQRALITAEQAVALAVGRRAKGSELQSRVALAQALRTAHGVTAASAIDSELRRCLALVAETGAGALEPRVRLELADLARLRGQRDEHERELREAQRLFVEIGAPALAASVAVGVS
jgi:class 3 adenylate cyclase/tetratricopeptide (TPR) repeat protein